MELEQAIRGRRTHKAYAPEPIDPRLLDELLELATWAPNHRLTNPWRFRVLGDAQAALRDTRERHGQTEIALSSQIARAEDVDMAETLSQLSFVQAQLEASYRLIAGANNLSLIKYLG